jgi:ankyrin repeat protein
MNPLDRTNNLNSSVPFSLSKRGSASNTPVSSPKKQKVEETAELRASKKAKELLPLKSAASAKNAELLACIERMKARQREVKPTILECVVKGDIQALRHAFDPQIYHPGNPKGIRELKDALHLLNTLDGEAFDVDGMRLALAELIAQIEDLEVIIQDGIFELYNHIDPSETESPVVLVLVEAVDEIKMLPNQKILEYRSPINRYSLLHYAAITLQLEIFTNLLETGLDPLERSDNGHTPFQFLIQALATTKLSPVGLLPHFDRIFPTVDWTEWNERLKHLIALVKESIAEDAWQMAVISLKKMGLDRNALEAITERLLPQLEQVKPSLGKSALFHPVPLQGRSSEKDVCERSLLHWAVAFENKPLLQSLLQRDVIRQKDGFSRSAFHYAAMVPDIDASIIEMLFAKDPQLIVDRDVFGFTPHDLALKDRLYDNFKILNHCKPVADSMINPYLLFAATNQPAKISERFEQEQQPIDDSHALHCAVVLGGLETIEECLKRANDVLCLDQNGYTPLALAVKRGDPQVIDQLFTYCESLGVVIPNREEIVTLIRTALMKPLQMDRALRGLTIEDFAVMRDSVYSPLTCLLFYGGPALLNRFRQGLHRVKSL